MPVVGDLYVIGYANGRSRTAAGQEPVGEQADGGDGQGTSDGDGHDAGRTHWVWRGQLEKWRGRHCGGR